MKERGQCFHRKLEKNVILFYGKPIDQNYGEQTGATIILADIPSRAEVPQFTMQEISEHSEQIKLSCGTSEELSCGAIALATSPGYV